MSNAEPFDRAARRQRRDRAAARFGDHEFLRHAVAVDLSDRAATFDRNFDTVLDLGCLGGRTPVTPALAVALDAGWACARDAGVPAVVADEDRLPFADASFDLVVSVLALHGVNDLPGALIQARRALRPGGLFLAALFGGVTLGALRRDLIEAETAQTGRVAARTSPMVDVQAAAGLLQRAGFVDPVVDVATFTVRYASLSAALADLHGMGEGNILASRVPLRRAVLAETAARFAARADADGRTTVEIEVLNLTGWGPGGSQSERADALKRRV